MRPSPCAKLAAALLLVAPLAGGDTLTLVSLYSDERVDVRLIRSDVVYAVAHLGRSR